MELRQYIQLLLRWWWLTVLLIAAAVGASYFVSIRQTPVYEATTTIMVGQSFKATDVGRDDFQTSQVLAQTYADMARRQPVLQAVVDNLNLSNSWRSLSGRIQANPVPGTQLLSITVEANSPEEARVTADEIANQLILLSPTSVQNQENDEKQRFVRQRLEDLQTKIEAGQKRVDELQVNMSGSLSADQVNKLQQEINTLEGLIAGWENTYTQLLIFSTNNKSVNFLAVIEPAQANSTPIRPQIELNIILAGAVGLLLSLGVIILIEYLDDTLKSASDISQILGLTVLGAVGQIKGRHPSKRLIAFQDLFSPMSEAYRMIRSNIQFMSVDRPAKSIVVTSSIPGEGKSTTAANLGVVMAQAGHKTVIVDADLRRPTQHEIFQVPNLGGLTDLLCSQDFEIESYLRKTSVDNLYLITCGVLPPNPSELLGSQRMGRLLTKLGELADVVIYDSPPSLTVTDALVLSNRADGTVLVVRSDETRRDAVKQVIANLNQAGAKILGCVLNNVSVQKIGYYSYKQAYYSPRKFTQGGASNNKIFQQPKPGRRWQWLPFFK
jgi:non-specific protein-tyrosine kinase